MHALRHCLSSYVLNFDNDEEATDEKNAKLILVSKRKRRGFVPRPKPAQNVNAARLASQSFSVTSPVTTGNWA